MASSVQTKKKAKYVGKAVNISARISQEDAVFLSQLKIADAVTPSDKLRAIITEARERKKRLKDYRGSIDMFQGMLTPFGSAIRELELTHEIHSELITRVLEWLPDMMAFVIVSETRIHKSTDQEQMKHIEEGIADRVFRLVESVMQLGVTQRSPCYKPNTISNRLDPVLDLARVISG